MSALMTTRINRLADDADENTVNLPRGTLCSARKGKLMRLLVAPAAPEQRILAVEFRSPEGRSWNAIGGGATVAAAIVCARESCPDDATWDAVSWNDLYGD
jgi:hypothetical protein